MARVRSLGSSIPLARARSGVYHLLPCIDTHVGWGLTGSRAVAPVRALPVYQICSCCRYSDRVPSGCIYKHLGVRAGFRTLRYVSESFHKTNVLGKLWKPQSNRSRWTRARLPRTAVWIKSSRTVRGVPYRAARDQALLQQVQPWLTHTQTPWCQSLSLSHDILLLPSPAPLPPQLLSKWLADRSSP